MADWVNGGFRLFSGKNGDFMLEIEEFREKSTQSRQKTAKKHQKTSKIVRHLVHHDCRSLGSQLAHRLVVFPPLEAALDRKHC